MRQSFLLPYVSSKCLCVIFSVCVLFCSSSHVSVISPETRCPSFLPLPPCLCHFFSLMCALFSVSPFSSFMRLSFLHNYVPVIFLLNVCYFSFLMYLFFFFTLGVNVLVIIPVSFLFCHVSIIFYSIMITPTVFVHLLFMLFHFAPMTVISPPSCSCYACISEPFCVFNFSSFFM
jgi:hypothetical protein